MKDHLGPEGAGEERLALYNAFKGVVGLGEPITQANQEKKVKGLLAGVFGSSPKFSSLQRKLMSSTVDNVGRAVVVPDPDLDMDSLGIPENQAFDIYSRFIARRLRRGGMGMTDALRHVRDRTPLARKALSEEMENGPVIMNRAPVLHKFGIMAFRPHLVAGNSVRVPPLVVKGFGMDFDGDAVQVHVPVSDEAKKEATELMLPSRQLISPADFKSPVHAPSQEYVAGLWRSTNPQLKSKHGKRTFTDAVAVRAAWMAGQLGINDEVEVLRK
jgi:DNA-directed RNA polymerase subunit beta'